MVLLISLLLQSNIWQTCHTYSGLVPWLFHTVPITHDGIHNKNGIIIKYFQGIYRFRYKKKMYILRPVFWGWFESWTVTSNQPRFDYMCLHLMVSFSTHHSWTGTWQWYSWLLNHRSQVLKVALRLWFESHCEWYLFDSIAYDWHYTDLIPRPFHWKLGIRLSKIAWWNHFCCTTCHYAFLGCTVLLTACLNQHFLL